MFHESRWHLSSVDRLLEFVAEDELGEGRLAFIFWRGRGLVVVFYEVYTCDLVDRV